jgi:hypothetical protein
MAALNTASHHMGRAMSALWCFTTVSSKTTASAPIP